MMHGGDDTTGARNDLHQVTRENAKRARESRPDRYRVSWSP
jgi:hypothetical protein